MEQSSNRNGNRISKTLEHSSETQTGFASPYGTLKEMIRRHGRGETRLSPCKVLPTGIRPHDVMVAMKHLKCFA